MLHRKRKHSSAVEEVKFDDDARADYLTGFHKRKLQRIKQAQEQAAKQDKADKIEARRQLRETRKADLEKHVDTVNKLLKEAQSLDRGSDESSESDSDDGVLLVDEGLDKAPVADHNDEYIDEDRFTSVTIENVQVTKDGLEKQTGDVDSDEPSEKKESEVKSKRVWTKEKPARPARPKKKKFRYENKADRKMTRHKERAGSRAQAMARKN